MTNGNGGNKYYVGAILTLCITLATALIYAGGMATRLNESERRIQSLETTMLVIQTTMVTKQDLKETKDEIKQSISDTHFNTIRGK